MNANTQSSDDLRSAKPLKYAQTFEYTRPLTLRYGGILPRVTVTYETYGKLNAAKDNAIVICHALSGDSHVAMHETNDDPGWWDIAVGPGKVIDTNEYFVICSNALGGCRGTTGPNSINPKTSIPYGQEFPVVSVEDMIDVQKMLVTHLGIDKLFAVIGGSLGGMQALCWATRYPDTVHATAVLASAPRLSAQGIAFDVVARNAILRDPNFNNGQYYNQSQKPDVGLALARMLGHITYLSPKAMHDKFERDKLAPRDVATDFEKKFSVGSYLAYQGDKFVERFDANSYLTLSMAMDMFDLGAERDQLEKAFSQTTCRWLILSFTSDWLFPASQSREMTDALICQGKCVSFCNIISDAGHDAFLLPNDLDRYGKMLGAFLNTTTTTGTFIPAQPLPEDQPTEPRYDLEQLIGLVDEGKSVLDLGCSRGSLLTRLAHERHAGHLVGVDFDEYKLQLTMQRGFDVVQGNLEEGLPDFQDKQFDYVVLSLTLQGIVHTEAIVDEMLRVGKRCIVSYPNFAYHKIRKMLFEEGRSPGAEGSLLHYDWYNTPNRRFLSILDWQIFCAERNITIHRHLFLNNELNQIVSNEPNLNADMAICVFSR
tara:strand:+ start:109 stop:1902 length:1794 start_codon:yes stop_codon:yes gene_type:complete